MNDESSEYRSPGPFLVYAIGRSGSTVLRHLLECHPAITCLHEPFNPSRRASNERVADSAELQQELLRIWSAYTGIKHVWDLAGWPFPKGSSLNHELLMQPGHRILFLNRRNSFQRLVSHQISKQASAWGLSADDRTAVRQCHFKPLNAGLLEYHLVREGPAIAKAREVILESANPFLEIWYEELFDPSAPIEKKEAMLDGIFEFLGADGSSFEETTRNRVRELLVPEEGRLNSPETYRRIPGIDEIEARFGSDETGWLFR